MSEVEGQKETRAEVALSGLPGSPGVALGKAAVLALGRTGVVHRHVVAAEVPAEIERFKAGVSKAAADLLPKTFSAIDQSAKKGIIKKNTAARYKSKLHTRVKAMAA